MRRDEQNVLDGGLGADHLAHGGRVPGGDRSEVETHDRQVGRSVREDERPGVKPVMNAGRDVAAASPVSVHLSTDRRRDVRRGRSRAELGTTETRRQE